MPIGVPSSFATNTPLGATFARSAYNLRPCSSRQRRRAKCATSSAVAGTMSADSDTLPQRGKECVRGQGAVTEPVLLFFRQLRKRHASRRIEKNRVVPEAEASAFFAGDLAVHFAVPLKRLPVFQQQHHRAAKLCSAFAVGNG